MTNKFVAAKHIFCHDKSMLGANWWPVRQSAVHVLIIIIIIITVIPYHSGDMLQELRNTVHQPRRTWSALVSMSQIPGASQSQRCCQTSPARSAHGREEFLERGREKINRK